MLIGKGNNDSRKKSKMCDWSLRDWQIIFALSKISHPKLHTRIFYNSWITSVLSEANLFKFKTGLPYDLWIDSGGVGRQVQHNKPRLKVNVNGDRIPVSIEDEPKILVNKKIPKFNRVASWIKIKRPVLLQYWDLKISEEDAIKLLYRT